MRRPLPTLQHSAHARASLRGRSSRSSTCTRIAHSPCTCALCRARGTRSRAIWSDVWAAARSGNTLQLPSHCRARARRARNRARFPHAHPWRARVPSPSRPLPRALRMSCTASSGCGDRSPACCGRARRCRARGNRCRHGADRTVRAGRRAAVGASRTSLRTGRAFAPSGTLWRARQKSYGSAMVAECGSDAEDADGHGGAGRK